MMTKDQEQDLLTQYASRRAVCLVETVEGLARGMKVEVDDVWGVIRESQFHDDARRYRGGFGYETALRPRDEGAE